MAAKIQSVDSFDKGIPSRGKDSISEIFIPKDTLDQSCDLVLFVKDGKQLKAHRRVLSEASLFFEKLLNSDMKETQEGVVRLEMFTESIMAATLQFIYTGDVQILTEDNARDLIVVADYLFLEKLKLLAGEVLVQTLNTSNCISTYLFAERYLLEDLLSNTSKFICANFSSIYAANRENVLNMSSREVEMWISSDELNVSAEEDVYKFILAWIEHDRPRRRRYFNSFVNHVRFQYVSLDFFRNHILTEKRNRNPFWAQRALREVYNEYCRRIFRAPPRKSLETSALVINVGQNILCYFPRENSWYQLGPPIERCDCCRKNFVPCDGQLRSFTGLQGYKAQCFWETRYDPYSRSCNVTERKTVQEHGRYLRKTFGRNEDKMYALMICLRQVFSLHRVNGREREQNIIVATKNVLPSS